MVIMHGLKCLHSTHDVCSMIQIGNGIIALHDALGHRMTWVGVHSRDRRNV